MTLCVEGTACIHGLVQLSTSVDDRRRGEHLDMMQICLQSECVGPRHELANSEERSSLLQRGSVDSG